MAWASGFVSPEIAFRRASGRRKYLANRQREAAERRTRMLDYIIPRYADLFYRGKPLHGTYSLLGRECGISYEQARRDIALLGPQIAALHAGSQVRSVEQVRDARAQVERAEATGRKKLDSILAEPDEPPKKKRGRPKKEKPSE